MQVLLLIGVPQGCIIRPFFYNMRKYDDNENPNAQKHEF